MGKWNLEQDTLFITFDLKPASNVIDSVVYTVVDDHPFWFITAKGKNLHAFITES